jgi:hypothetical protein
VETVGVAVEGIVKIAHAPTRREQRTVEAAARRVIHLSDVVPEVEAVAPTRVPAHDHHVHGLARKSEECNGWGESEYQEKKTKPLATKMIQTFELGIVSMVHFSSLTLLSSFLLFLTSTTIFLNSKKIRRNNQKHCRILHFPSKVARFITLKPSP